MNKYEAREVLQQQMSVYRQRRYVDLVSLIGDVDAFATNGPSGAEYQIEIMVFWDTKPYELVRVIGGVDDGGLSAFAPLTDDFIMDPDGTFVGEPTIEPQAGVKDPQWHVAQRVHKVETNDRAGRVAGRVEILRGLPEGTQAGAAELYDQAFGAKMSVAIGDEEKRLVLWEAWIVPEFVLAAMSGPELMGMAGLSTTEGSFIGAAHQNRDRRPDGKLPVAIQNEMAQLPTYRELVSLLGWLKGSWAALVLSLYDEKVGPGEVLIDCLAVRSEFRGLGIGSRLLEEVNRYAVDKGYGQVRLHVIDTNPSAKRLYERKGFVSVKKEKFPYLRWLLGFGGSTTMIRAVNKESNQ